MKKYLLLACLWISPLASAQAASVAEIAATNSPAFGAALEKAGLASLLKGSGPFTVFVPNSEAFAKQGSGWEKAQQDPERLKAVVTYHIVPGKLSAAELKDMIAARTMNGKELKISVDAGKVQVNKAKVLGEGIVASNGLVYLTDTLLFP